MPRSRRKRWLRQPLSWRRGGAIALMALVLVAGAALVLDTAGTGEYAAVADRLSERGREPVALVEEVGRAARIVILADVHGRAGPKRLAASAIRRLAEGPGLDAVVLEVPSSEQRHIDAYLTSPEDDAAALLSRPAAVQDRYGTPREYLGIYQAVKGANQGLPPGERIRVVAADIEGWPPPEGTAPADVARLYSARAEHMLNRMDQELFRVTPDARILVVVDGYMAMQGTSGVLRSGGGEPVRVEWLGELLRRRSGPDARSILVDTGAPLGSVQRRPDYQGTRMHRPLRRELDRPVASRVAGPLTAVQDAAIELSTPGLTLEILPEGYRLGEAAQGYVFLPGGR